MTRRVLFEIALLLSAMTAVNTALISRSSITLSEGGYSNVVVAIDENIEEDQSLIDAIMKMFSDGSPYIFEATRHRLYFKDITILIPSHWSPKSSYGSPGRLTFDTADIIVAEPNPLWAPDPYTQQIEGCGKPGSFIHFGSEFLTDENVERNYGNLGRVLVHEWGHYRWGLFNEYPDVIGDPDYATYFYQSLTDGKWRPVSCSNGYRMQPVIIDRRANFLQYRPCQGNEDVGYENGCVAIPRSTRGATSSIMFGQLAFNKIKHFCDNDTSDRGNLHTREAINKHNRLCDSKSAWEVMRGHPDFNDELSPPRELSGPELIPTFTFVQSRTADECRVVLVLDTSGSMQSANRIAKVISASTAFVNLVRDGTWVGIVTFTGGYSIRHNLVQVNNAANRQSLRNTLSLSASGSTCIGCGLEGGLQVLGQYASGIVDGGIILLMTDGEDSGIISHPIRQTLQDQGVRVDTVAIGQDAYGALNTIAQETGGSATFYADNAASAEILSALSQTAEQCSGVAETQKRIQLLSDGYFIDVGESREGSLWLDPSIGNNTQFVVTYTAGSSSIAGVNVVVTQPNKENITVGSQEYNNDFERRIVTISISGQAMSGEWRYAIENTYSTSQSVTLSVYSQAVSDKEEPILVESEVSVSTLDLSNEIEPFTAYVQIRKGFRPVIGVKVVAIIERPGAVVIELPLLDNGAGADITANDGIYSRFFTEYSSTGFYGVRVVAENSGDAKVLTRPRASRATAFINITDDGDIMTDRIIGNYEVRIPGDASSQVVELEDLAPFSRGSSAGSTSVSSFPPSFVPGQDLFPPSRILDLRVKMTSVLNLTVTLTWTSPGDDLDAGTAAFYEIRISNSSDLLATAFENGRKILSSDILKGNMSNPKPFGGQEEFVVLLPDVEMSSSFSYAIAIRAVDEIGRTSEVSNLALATFRRFIPSPPTSNPCVDMVCQNGGILNEDRCICNCPEGFEGFLCDIPVTPTTKPSIPTYLIVIIVVAFVALMFFMAVLIVFFSNVFKKKRASPA